MNTNCPYCDEPISKDAMLLYFVDDEGFDTIEKLCASGNEDIFVTHNSDGSKYKKHWGPRNVKAQGEKGIVVDMRKLRQLLEDKDDGVIPLDDDPENVIKVHLDFSDPKESYFKEPTSSKCKPKAYLCPHCWNFYPLNYFDHDNYTILLIAPSNTGKSAFSAALLANVCQRLTSKSIPANREKLRCKFNEILCETLQRESSKAFADFTWYNVNRVVYHKLPLETENAIPPIFLTFTLSRPNQEDYRFNVALVDTKGEGWANHDPNVTSFIHSCDGVIYFTEPKQSTRLIHKADRDQGNEAANSDADAPVQAGYESEGMPVFLPEEAEDEQEERNKLIGAADIFNVYFQRTSSPIDPETPIAFVLTKFDQLLDNKQYILPEGTEPVFFDQLKQFKDPLQRKTLLDTSEMLIHNIAATQLFDRIFPELNISTSDYTNVNCFCTSSFTGEPVNGMLTQKQFEKAYNLHLPFLWLLTQIIDFDSPKASDNKQPEVTPAQARPRPSAPAGERRHRRQRSADAPSADISNARRVNQLIDDD